MENSTIKKLIKRGHRLLNSLEILTFDVESSNNLNIKINDWVEESLKQLSSIGKDVDEITLLETKNPMAWDIFYFDKIKNKTTRKQSIRKLKEYIILVLEMLITNKLETEKEGVICFNEEEIYITIKRKRVLFKLSGKRKNLLIKLLRSSVPISGPILGEKNKQTLSLISSEIEKINERFNKKYSFNQDLIINNGGYEIDRTIYKTKEIF